MRRELITRFARWLALAATAIGLAAGSAFGEVTTASQLKATFLINFIKYVEWPEADTTITLCLFGRNNLMPYLTPHEGRQIGGRELRIRKVSSPEQFVDCQELFISESEAAHFTGIMRWVDKQAILTVSDAETFTHNGGAIAIVRSEGQIRFDINADALEHASLRASPLMIRLARQVTGTPR
jgi:hypothetical protein